MINDVDIENDGFRYINLSLYHEFIQCYPEEKTKILQTSSFLSIFYIHVPLRNIRQIKKISTSSI